MSMLSILAGWKGYAAVALVAAGAGGWLVWTIQDAALSDLRAQQAQVLEKQAQATVASVEAARKLEQQRTAAVEKERDNAQEKYKQAAADAAARSAATQRLRQRIDQVLANARSLNPAFADGGQTAGDPLDLLADLLTRSLETAGQLATYADQARIAGLTCERSYDAVRALQSK